MELIQLLTTSRLNIRDYIVSVLNFFIGVVMLSFALNIHSQENLHFRCDYVKKTATVEGKDYYQKTCFHRYNDRYNLPFTLYMFMMVNFFIPTAVSMVYSYILVKGRVDRVEEACSFDKENPRRIQEITTKRVFVCYLGHLIIRFCFRLSFALLFLDSNFLPKDFPSQFYCKLNFINLKCVNSLALDKTNLATVANRLNFVFAGYLLLEIVYLIGGVCAKRDFMYDSEFCQKYLLRKLKVPLLVKQKSNKKQIKDQIQFLEPLLPTDPGHNRIKLSLDDIYTDVHIVDISSKKKETSNGVKLENLLQDSPRTILIMGEKGIGKSFLCTKLLGDWCDKDRVCGQEFQHTFLFRFRHLNSKSMKEISLRQFLDRSEHSIGRLTDDIFQCILNNAEKILIVFDGLDEFEDLDKCIRCENGYAGFNSATDKIQVSALFVKLLQNKLLPGATIIVTTARLNAIESGELRIWFDKVLQIKGFEAETVKKYVEKLFKKHSEHVHKEILEHIQSNLIIQELCKIPEICFVVCSWFEFNMNEESTTLKAQDSRLTRIFDEILRMFILRHHDFKTALRKPVCYEWTDLYSEANLKRLGSLAIKGLEGKRLVEQKELEKYGLKKSCLMICVPNQNDVLRFGHVAPPQWQFALPYLQEFLAAKTIVTEAQRSSLRIEDIERKAKDPKWHVVLQFVAGLISDESKKGTRMYETVVQMFSRILKEHITGSDVLSMPTALNMMKCLHELNDDKILNLIASELSLEQLDFSSLGVSPVDCLVMADFLSRLQSPLKVLNLRSNDAISHIGLSKLVKLIELKSPKKLNISSCKVTDKGLEDLMKASRKENSTLTNLVMSDNPDITKTGIKDLSLALQDEMCNIKKLDLYGIKLCEEGAQLICEALKASSCRLSELYINLNVEFRSIPSVSRPNSQCRRRLPCHRDNTDLNNNCCPCFPNRDNRDADPEANPNANDGDTNPNRGWCHCLPCTFLCHCRCSDHTPPLNQHKVFKALIHEESTLVVLGLRDNEITDDGLRLICEIIKNAKCQLKKLYLNNNQITDKGLDNLISSLTDQNCTLKELHLESNRVTCADRDVNVTDRLCEAFKSENFKLSTLNIARNEMISDVTKEKLFSVKPESLSLQL